MERLFYIKFYDDHGRTIARQDYSGLQFVNKEVVEKYINSEKREMEERLSMKLKLNPYHREIPTFSVRNLILAYCKVTGYAYDEIVGKGRNREKVNVRMFIVKTALELGFVHGQLRTFFPDGLSYHYEKSFNDLLDAGSMTVKLWREFETKAMRELSDRNTEDEETTKVDESQ
jgi:hypothetical protein